MDRTYVAHYSGHRCLGDRDRRWQGVNRFDPGTRIQHIIAEYGINTFVGSLAAGADIVFAEQALAAGCALYIYLPTSTEVFQRACVAPAGGDWTVRFEQVLPAATAVSICGHSTSDDYAWLTRLALDRTIALAAAVNTTAMQLVIWDGHDAGKADGTAADIRQAKSLGMATVNVAAPTSSGVCATLS